MTPPPARMWTRDADDAAVKAALSERDTLTLTLLGEARGEELEGRLAVASVIRNRMEDQRWPDTIKDVCLQRMQFSCWQSIGGAANYKAVMDMARLLIADHPFASAHVSDALYQETRWLAEGVLNGVVRSRVGEANHYITRQLWETAAPSWAVGHVPSAIVSRHVFFRL